MLRSLIAGSVAAATSAIALAFLARLENKSASQPINATSHWLNGDDAADYRGIDKAHTGIGFATHHAAAVMWGALFEKLREKSSSNRAISVVRDAAATSAIAAVVDYTITPHRLTPGWELVLTRKSMAVTYAAMALGFVAAEYALPVRKQKSRRLGFKF